MERPECKKRKELVVGDDGEEYEEEKMEKFFALIRSFREARNRLMTNCNGSSDPTRLKEIAGEDQKKKRRIDGADPDKTPLEAYVWKPTFQPEDFLAAGMQFENTLHRPAVQGNGAPEKEENVKESIDLNLSL